MRETQGGREGFHDDHWSGTQALDYIDAKSISTLENAPFEFACLIAHTLNVDQTAVLNHLQKSWD
jgi:hypothetical protein